MSKGLNFPPSIKQVLISVGKTNKNIPTYVLYSLIFDIVINMYKPFQLNFLERIGGTELHISLLSALPGLVAIFALIPGSMFVAKFKSKKKVTVSFIFASRLFILAFSIIPLIYQPFQPLIFVIIASLMNFPEAISQTALQALLGESFVGNQRSTAISLRNQFGQIVTLTVTLITGLIIRFVPQNNGQTLIAYQIFFIFSFVISLFEIRQFLKFDEKEVPQNAAHSLKFKDIAMVFKDAKFSRFLILTLIFYFSWQLAWPVVSAFQIKYLKADEIWFAVFAVVSGLSSYFSAGFWQKFTNKHGNEKGLLLAVFGMSFNLLLYVFARNLWLLLPITAYSGVMVIGTNITLLRGLLDATPDENRVVYIAVYNTFVNVSLALTPILSYWFLVNVSYFTTFLIFFFVRLLAAGLIFLEFMHRRKKNSVAK